MFASADGLQTITFASSSTYFYGTCMNKCTTAQLLLLTSVTISDYHYKSPCTYHILMSSTKWDKQSCCSNCWSHYIMLENSCVSAATTFRDHCSSVTFDPLEGFQKYCSRFRFRFRFRFNSFIIVTCHQYFRINFIHYILQYGPSLWV